MLIDLMKANTDEHALTDRPQVAYENRFVEGIVLPIKQEVLHLRLVQEFSGKGFSAQWARVTTEDLPLGKKVADFQEGDRLLLFLIRPTKTDPNLWFGSIAWANPSNNPWDKHSKSHPRKGEEVTGTVIGYSDNSKWAIISLDINRIQAYLSIEQIPHDELPSGESSIANILHVGDRLQAEIIEVDSSRLSVELSVNKAIENLKGRFRSTMMKVRKERHDDHAVFEAITEPVKDSPFAGLRILLIEHEHIFAQHLGVMLQGLGAEVEVINNKQHLEQLLRNGPPFTHVLSDYHMGGEEQRKELQATIAKLGVPVALMSGDYGEAKSAAEKMHWAMLPKPVAYADMKAWLLDGKTPEPPADEAALSQTWGLGVESQAYLRRAESYLSKFCQQTDALGAFWVRAQRPGIYAILAAYGLDNDRLLQAESHFGHSLIHQVIEENKWFAFPLKGSNPLTSPAPNNAQTVIGLPLIWEGMHVPDALVVYIGNSLSTPSEAKLKPVWEAFLNDLATNLSLLDELTMMAEWLIEAESFATMGRATSAVLHEIRQALQPLETYVTLTNHGLANHAPLTELAEYVNKIIAAKERITSLVKADLYNVQKARRQTINLNKRIPEIMAWFYPNAQRYNLLLKFLDIPQPIILFVPPEVVEQPLTNLLDNAVYQLSNRKWGAITVSLRFDADHASHPISIDVIDQGKGMTAEQCQGLFTPRVSAKGVKGYGLGLYTSRQLLRAIGGDLLRVESIRWQGSTFRILLPYKIAEAKE